MENNSNIALMKSFINETDKILNEVKQSLSMIDSVIKNIEEDFKRESLKDYYAEFSKEIKQILVIRYEISKIVQIIFRYKEEMTYQFFIEKNPIGAQENFEHIPIQTKRLMTYVSEILIIFSNLEDKFEICRQKHLFSISKEEMSEEGEINFEYIELGKD